RDLAPSQDSIYLEVDGGFGSVMYGDFLPPGGENRFVPRVGQMTGLLASTNAGGWEIAAFTSPGRWAERYDEILAEGVSGPYSLEHAPIVSGSETVWLVRVQWNGEVETVVERPRLLRSGDYILDVRTGD